ncbi:hypothetical protein GBAR_LOCUS7790 [Geodia barretti]|uniref:Solute-binding protein family 5 domain-containing protein n=1 Tax=Geodia barretti TaxID=519541 RepID=A0AA35RIH7_GEOBA|nr:hypothetical protein GBAR_LOCUS7790 [Geodia barretti]
MSIQPGGRRVELVKNPVLAETWTVADDWSKVTVKVKEGVQFHRGWGEMTADDLVWSFNDLIAPESVHNQSGDYAAVFEHMLKIDDYTVEVPLKGPNVVWNQAYFKTTNLQRTQRDVQQRVAFLMWNGRELRRMRTYRELPFNMSRIHILRTSFGWNRTLNITFNRRTCLS